MPANEFEKQVQKQLDDFQLNPSASVWKKVEEQIRRKRKRRVIVFFFLPVLLGLLGYSVYYFLNTDQKTEAIPQEVAVKKNNSSATDNNNLPATKEQPGKSTTEEKIKSNGSTVIKPNEKTVVGRKKETGFQISSNDPSTGRRKNKPAVIHDDQIAIEKKKTNSPPVANKNIQTNNDVDITIDKPETRRITKDPIAKQPVTSDQSDKAVVDHKYPMTVKTDSVKTEIVTETVNKESIETVNKETITKKNAAKPKIKWGIDVSGGVTSNQSQVFPLLKSGNADAAYSNPNSATSGAFPFPGGSLTLPPSSSKPGAAFRIGVVGELQVSKRSKVSMGMQYAYASNRIKTGTADRALRLAVVNNFAATVDQVYRGPQDNSYTNSYHFVSIPVNYHWQINKSKKLAVQWNAGISPSYLVATNALVYSSFNGGSYYYDKSAINKFHLSVETGLSLRLKGKKGMEYIIGPEVSFDTRKLNNDTYEKKQYLIYWGIGTRLLFSQRKNK